MAADKQTFSIGGLASKPTWTRGNREHQFIFINRRPVESRALSQAIVQAYREVVPAGRHPAPTARHGVAAPGIPAHRPAGT